MKIKNPHGGGETLWHTAFFEAIQMELDEYSQDLQFISEHPLNTEPLRIDVVIIKKPRDVAIEKNIASIFRKENIVEYKSPDDYLAVKDFLKVYAYANLYAAITPGVDFADMTLTFVENRHPRKLLKYLTGTRGYTVEETSPGIYMVSGDYLPIQIIESRKLHEQENLWLRSLTKGLHVSNAAGILERVDKCGNKASMGSYLDVLLRANAEAFKEARDMSRRGLPTLEEALEQIGILPIMIERSEKKGLEQGLKKGLEQGRVQGLEQGLETAARNALAEGASIEFVNKITGLDIETLEQIAKSN
jgi:hypothetical protein